MESLSAVPSADMKIPSDCLFKEMTVCVNLNKKCVQNAPSALQNIKLKTSQAAKGLLIKV